jgi:hypothetical protein
LSNEFLPINGIQGTVLLVCDVAPSSFYLVKNVEEIQRDSQHKPSEIPPSPFFARTPSSQRMHTAPATGHYPLPYLKNGEDVV